MILFLEDWNRHPTAIPDTTTRNTSWLRYVDLLRTMGIRNHAFPLALHNPKLQGIDPFSLDLTVEQMVQIQLEAKFNPWYFYREILRVPPSASPEPLPMLANRGNISLWWLAYNHIDAGLTQPRQTGKSLSSDGLTTHIKDVAAENTKLLLLTKDNSLRLANIDRLKKMREYLPSYIARISKEDADNKTEMTNVALGNKYVTAVGQNSEAGALNLGRGLTAAISEVDESPFIPYIDVTLPAMLASTRAAREEAKATGGFYFNIFPTTAGKKDSRSGAYMYDMFMGAMPWTENLFDCQNQMELVRIVDKNSPGRKKMVYINLLHHHLGKDDEWLYNAMAEANATGEAAERDFMNRWTSGSGSSPISTKLLEVIAASKKNPVWVETFSEGYCINWYITENELATRARNGRMMVGGMDTSEGLGRDQITLVMVDSENLEVLGAMAVDETNLILFSNWIVRLMVKYSNLILIPERKSSGMTIIDNLLLQLPNYNIDPFRRIYNLIIDEALWKDKREFEAFNDPLIRRPMQFYDKCKRYFGFTTAGSGYHSRNGLYENTLQKAARLGGHCINDGGLTQEITSLVVKNGRIDHTAGGHDDRVIGWLLAVWMLSWSKNLSYYGIHTPLIGAMDYTKLREEEVKSPYDKYTQMKQDNLKREIAGLLLQLKDVEEDITAIYLEDKIRNLNAKLKDENSLPMSLDSLIKEANHMRSRKIEDSKRSIKR